jgi:hypothetical protein
MTKQTEPSELFVSLEADQLYQDCTNILLGLAGEPVDIAEAHEFLLRLQGLALKKLMSSAMQSNQPVTPEMSGKEKE